MTARIDYSVQFRAPGQYRYLNGVDPQGRLTGYALRNERGDSAHDLAARAVARRLSRLNRRRYRVFSVRPDSQGIFEVTLTDRDRSPVSFYLYL